MQKLITLTALFIAGRWLQPGSDVPLNVPGFDYAKAYRKGMLEAEDGSEVLNPEPEAAVALVTTPAESGSDEATLRTQAVQLTRERHEALTALQAFQGLDATSVRTDLAALAEYREALGELLPATFPGRPKLFAGGYYTAQMLQGVDKATLTSVPGIGDATADQILAALTPPK